MPLHRRARKWALLKQTNPSFKQPHCWAHGFQRSGCTACAIWDNHFWTYNPEQSQPVTPVGDATRSPSQLSHPESPVPDRINRKPLTCTYLCSSRGGHCRRRCTSALNHAPSRGPHWCNECYAREVLDQPEERFSSSDESVYSQNSATGPGPRVAFFGGLRRSPDRRHNQEDNLPCLPITGQ